VEKTIKWGDLYLDKCMENEDLKNEIRILQEILRVYLPIIEDKSEDSRGDK
tara:strand:+ start:518 stop:670 length:153 start_codon:yes stop_codon:yes gene_type:complete